MTKNAIALLGGVVFFSQLAWTQVTTGTISGVVSDATGAVVPGASVVVRNVETGVSRTLSTEEQGRYRAPNLNVGQYEVQASLTGFQTAVRSGITLTVGQEAVVNITLVVGQVTERVEVSGEAPLVNTTSGVVGELVVEREILNLPLNARSFEQLAFLEPGVIQAVAAGAAGRGGGIGQKMTIAGTRPEMNAFFLDGTDMIDAGAKTPGTAGGLLGVEAIREFRAVTNPFAAEYPRIAGGAVIAATKSGANELRGSAFWFHRNDNLDARNFFDVKKPEFRRQQFGGALGGPIVRNKTFFFGNYEGLRQALGTTDRPLVPDEQARQGLLPTGPGGQLVNVGVHPDVRPYLNFYPLPTPGGKNVGGGLAEFILASRQITRDDFFTVRVDHQLTSADSLMGRYRFSDSTILTPNAIPPITRRVFLDRRQYATLEYTRIFSPSALNAVNLSFSRTSPLEDYEFEPVSPELQFLPGRRAAFGAITISGGVAALGPSQIGPPVQFLQNLFQVHDNLSLTKGNHWMKMGADIYRFRYNGYTSSRQLGQYRFTSLQNFLRKQVNNFEFLVDPGSSAPRGARSSIIGFYFQDEWKVLPRLTLNLGVRYEFFTTPTEIHGRVANFRFRMDPTTTVGDPFIDNPSFDQVAPRIGFAWDPLGDGKTSVRGGWGLFYSNPTPFDYFNHFQQNPPFYENAQVLNADFPHAVVAGASLIPSFIYGVQFDLETPYVMQWGLQVQRDIGWDTVVNLGYTGSRGVHLVRLVDNTALPQISPDGTKFFPAGSRPRNQNLQTVRYSQYDSNSFYHGFLLSVTKRYARGLQFRTSYTFSKVIDEASNAEGQAAWVSTDQYSIDPDDVHRDRGLAPMHQLHNLALSSTYDLPFGSGKRLGGWQVGVIGTVGSGTPINLRVTFNRSQNAATGSAIMDRPNLRPGASNSPVLGGPDRYFDASAFELQPAGYFGNLGRNTLIGPGRVSVDFSLVKNTPLSERLTSQFRAEIFNLFNRPNFGIPAREVFDPSGRIPSAGRISTTTSSSRQIQFSLKFLF